MALAAFRWRLLFRADGAIALLVHSQRLCGRGEVTRWLGFVGGQNGRDRRCLAAPHEERDALKPVATFADIQRELTTLAEANPEGGTVEIGFQLNAADRPLKSEEVKFDADTATALAAAGWSPPIPGYFFERAAQRVSGDNLTEAASVNVWPLLGPC